MITKRVALATIAAVSILALGGCAGATKQSSPDPTGDHIHMTAPHAVIGMPDGFRNVAEACDDGGNMILVTSRGSDLAGGQNGGGLSSGIAVILNDSRCKR